MRPNRSTQLISVPSIKCTNRYNCRQKSQCSVYAEIFCFCDDKSWRSENFSQHSSTCVRAFVRSCVRAFVRSCVRAFVRSCVRTFVRSSVRPFVRSCVRSCVRAFVRSCVRAFVRSCVRAFVRPCVRTSVYRCTSTSLPGREDASTTKIVRDGNYVTERRRFAASERLLDFLPESYHDAA